MKNKGKKSEDQAQDEHAQDNINIAAETAKGDLRDAVISWIHNIKKPWAQMSESEQRELVALVDKGVESALRQVARLVASEGHKTISGILKSVTITDKMKAVVEVSKSDELRHELSDCTNQTVLLVVTDTEKYMGESGPVDIDEDQPGMTLGEEEEAE